MIRPGQGRHHGQSIGSPSAFLVELRARPVQYIITVLAFLGSFASQNVKLPLGVANPLGW